MRHRLIGLIVLISMMMSGSIPAQNALEIESLTIDLWPEFDRPDLLVIYHIKLPPQFQTFSQRISIRLPREAGKPFALASRALDGTLYEIKDYEINPDGDWIRVTFIPTGSEIQLEYYDTRLQKNGMNRKFEFRWPGDYAVKSLGIQVQKPFNAENLTTTPPIGSGQIGQDGLTYFNLLWGRVDANAGFTLTLSYQKPDDKLTMDATQQQVKPAVPITSSNPAPAVIQDALPWLLGFIGVVMVIGVVIWYWRSEQKTTQPIARNKRKADNRRESGPMQEAGDMAVRFCQQCGKKSVHGDVYCRSCGTKLHNG